MAVSRKSSIWRPFTLRFGRPILEKAEEQPRATYLAASDGVLAERSTPVHQPRMGTRETLVARETTDDD